MLSLYILHTKVGRELHSLETEFKQICCNDSRNFALAFLVLWIVSVIKLTQISLERNFPESYLGEHVTDHF